MDLETKDLEPKDLEPSLGPMDPIDPILGPLPTLHKRIINVIN